jgi:hypothetical protein
LVKAKKSNCEPGTKKTDAVSEAERQAEIALDPVLTGAAAVECFAGSVFGSVKIEDLYVILARRARDVRNNKLGSVEDILTAQAAALDAIFTHLARRAHLNLGEYINAAERYLRLGLKAQAQCRATLETLAAIKNAPVVYARQANIAAGHQQVNNAAGPPLAREKNSEDLPNELLEAPGDTIEGLDGGTAGASIGSDPRLEPVEPVHRPPHSRRKSTIKS